VAPRCRADGVGVTRSDLTHAAATAALELLPDGEVLPANRALCPVAPEAALAEVNRSAGTHLRPDAGTLLRQALGWLSGASR
jgi:hypothetical protein